MATLIGGGSGGVFAAALCLYVRCEPNAAAGERVDLGAPAPGAVNHCHESSTGSLDESHAASGGTEHEPAGQINSNLFDPHGGLCAHCIGGPQPQRPLGFERQAEPSKRLDSARPTLANVLAVPRNNTLIPQVVPIRGAPPGSTAPRHLLISIFRI